MRILLALVVASIAACAGRGPVSPSDVQFDFQADIRLFTAYAFMNAAGNDAEWRKAGMHPVRIAVRNEIEGKLTPAFRDRIRAFNSEHGGSWTIYGSYALLTSGPPDFRPAYDPRTTPGGAENEKSKAGLSELFAEFARQAGLERLWKKYRPLLQAENDRFRPFAAKALDDITAYCRLRTGFFGGGKRIHFQSVPLMLYFTAWTMDVNGETWIVSGPQEGQPDASAFYHEALHHVVGPLVERYAEAIARSAELNAVSKSRGSLGYDSWPELVEDCFTRTLDKILQAKLYGLDRAKLHQMLEDEYKLGFILCFTIAESLEPYESQSRTFEEFFPEIIARFEVAGEQRRWEAFWSKP
jgi:hypothetical protein